MSIRRPFGEYGEGKITPEQVFITGFIFEILKDYQDRKIDFPDLLTLSGAISGTHTHQSESRTHNLSFFELIGPEWEEKLRPAYRRALELANKSKGRIKSIDLDSSATRSMYKEISTAYEACVKPIVERGG